MPTPAITALHSLVQAIATDRAWTPPAALPAGLIDLVRRHALGPLAYRAGITALRADLAGNAFAAEARAVLVAELAALLATRAIPVCLIKGAAYVHTIYPDPALRPMGDVDILVPEARHAEAIALLAAHGFVHAGGAWQHADAHHALGLRRGGVAVDVHRRILQAGRSRWSMAEVWAGTTPGPDGTGLRPPMAL